ncbi:unnamed protein product [Lactuca virosa]|uniref:Uncharacterized protein n=1 Tax=Lactuca virosa TaxID=75947 RepID=A0AAU9PIS4_9ASTR|nr:unnamed protein product [Lactuca virosa]
MGIGPSAQILFKYIDLLEKSKFNDVVSLFIWLLSDLSDYSTPTRRLSSLALSSCNSSRDRRWKWLKLNISDAIQSRLHD